MKKWFPKLDDIVLEADKHNESWLHSVWLGVWLPISNMPDIFCHTIGSGILKLLIGIWEFTFVILTPLLAGILGMVTVRPVAKPPGPDYDGDAR